MKDKDAIRQIAGNKKAYHDFEILEKFQAGIELVGTEVKSLRSGRCNLKDSYIKIQNGEAYIYSMHISPYEFGNRFNLDPLRPRKLLLHKSEILRLDGKVAKDGLTIVPTSIYFRGSYVKVNIGLAKGKKLYDKRHDIAKKDQKRQAEKEFKIRNLGA